VPSPNPESSITSLIDLGLLLSRPNSLALLGSLVSGAPSPNGLLNLTAALNDVICVSKAQNPFFNFYWVFRSLVGRLLPSGKGSTVHLLLPLPLANPCADIDINAGRKEAMQSKVEGK
jgi:hypothetical protein